MGTYLYAALQGFCPAYTVNLQPPLPVAAAAGERSARALRWPTHARRLLARPMSSRPFTCDVSDCKVSGQTFEPHELGEDYGIPKGWGHVVLSDSQNEEQSFWICPRHNLFAWEVLKL